jgi:1-acyl-sn-glycerol-3-phosphate acyltransferase
MQAGVKKVPFVGFIAERLGSVFVDRDAKPGTPQATNAVIERQRTYAYRA